MSDIDSQKMVYIIPIFIFGLIAFFLLAALVTFLGRHYLKKDSAENSFATSEHNPNNTPIFASQLNSGS